MALHPAPLNYISLCPGGGGLDFGLELAIPGARSVCLVEREAFAVARLVSAMEQGLMAPAPLWSDVRTFDGRPWRGIVDGVIGGIPCQPHSLAGKRLGRDDERDLWPAARRILVQSGAWWLLLENVGGFLSSQGGGERVWNDLHRLGFDVEAGLFTAEEVGAPHQRERLFLLAVNEGRFLADAARFGKREPHDKTGAIARKDTRQGADSRSNAGVGLADACRAGLQGREFGRSLGERHGSEASRSASKFYSPLLAHTDCKGSFPAAQSGIRGCEEGAGPRYAQPEQSGGSLAHTNGNALRREDGPGSFQGEAGALETAPCWPNGKWSRTRSGDGREDLVNTALARGGAIPVQSRRQEQAGSNLDRPSLFPPGPSDLDGWRSILATAPHLEPAVRRVADGLASRVDQLRMLGNGVVPLQAGYAIRTLVTRLACRSAGAAFLAGLLTGNEQ